VTVDALVALLFLTSGKPYFTIFRPSLRTDGLFWREAKVAVAGSNTSEGRTL